MALPPPQFVFGQLAEAQRQVDATRHRMEVFRDAWARLHLHATEAMSTLKRVTRMLEEATANECAHTDESLRRRNDALTQAKLVLHRELPSLPDTTPLPEHLRPVNYAQGLAAMGYPSPSSAAQQQYGGPSPHSGGMGGFAPNAAIGAPGANGVTSGGQGSMLGANDVLNQLIAASVLRPVGGGAGGGGGGSSAASVGARGASPGGADRGQFEAMNASTRSLPAPSSAGPARASRASTPSLNASWNGSGDGGNGASVRGNGRHGSLPVAAGRSSGSRGANGSGVGTAVAPVSRSGVTTSVAPSPTSAPTTAPSAASKLASLAMSPGSASSDGSGIGAGTLVYAVGHATSTSIGDAAVSSDLHQHRRLLSGAPRPSTRNLFCVSCGYTGPVGTKFCGRCGNPSGFVAAAGTPTGPATAPAGIRLARGGGDGSPQPSPNPAPSPAPAPAAPAPTFPPSSAAVAHPDGSIHGVLIRARDHAFVLCTAKVVNHHLRLMPVTPVHGSLVSTGQPEVVLPISFMTRLLRVDCGDAPLPPYVPNEFVFRIHGHDGVGHTLWAPDERSMSLYLRVLADASGQRVDVVPLALALRRNGGGESSSGSSSEDEGDSGGEAGGAGGRPPVVRTATGSVCWNCAAPLVQGTRFCGRCGMGQSQADANAAWGGAGGASDPKRIHPSRSETDLEALAQEARDAERKARKVKKHGKHKNKKHRGDVSTAGKSTSKVEGYLFKAFVSAAVDVDKSGGQQGAGSGGGGSGADEEVAVESVVWVPDHLAPKCMMNGCSVAFTSFGNRRHHCRLCGKVYCLQHSLHMIKVANVMGVDSTKPQRVCDICYARVASGGPAVKPATETDTAPRKKLVDPTASRFGAPAGPGHGHGHGHGGPAASATEHHTAGPSSTVPGSGGSNTPPGDGRPRYRPRGMSIFEDIDLAFDEDDEPGGGGTSGGAGASSGSKTGRGDKKHRKKKKKKRGLLKDGAGGSTAHSSMPIRGDPQYNDFHERVRREEARLAAVNAGAGPKTK